MASTNLKYTYNSGNDPWNIWATVTEFSTSGTTKQIQLTIYVQASDYDKGRNGYYTAKCTEANVDTGRVTCAIPGSAQSPLEILNEKFDVTLNNDNTASVNVLFTAGFTSQSYGGDRTASGSLTEIYFDSGGESGDSTSSHTMYINPGKGTKITVLRTWSDNAEDRGDYLAKDATESTTAIIYYPNDRFEITAEALPGYEIDYYSDDDPFYTENLTKFYSEDNTYKYHLSSSGDVSITSTATAIATVHIYNKDNSDWDKYAPYIYNKDSGWERYTSYVYNSSNTTWDRYS